MLQINSNAIQNISNIPLKPVDENALEQTLGLSLIADYDQQLGNISNLLQSQLNQKQEIRSEMDQLNSFYLKDEIPDPFSRKSVVVTTEERDALMAKGYKNLQFTIKDNGHTYYLTKESLKTTLEAKQEEMAGINSNSEITMLQVQTLVDQRKNSMLLLTNLMASRNDTLMNIIRNMKN